VGLRPRLTLVATAVVAVVSALLLWLGWLLIGNVAAAVPALPPGTMVRVGEVSVPAELAGEALAAAARWEALRAGLIAFPLVVAAGAVVSWVLVGRVLGPLRAVTATARRLTVESLDTRIGLRDARGEVAELAAGFDAMLDRLQAAFDAQRRFVANASHELRTPLAVLRTEVDVTLSDPDADEAELRRMAAVVRDATRRADDLVAGLLLLARTEGTELATRTPVDLAEVLVPALSAVRKEVAERGLRVQVHSDSAPCLGDPVLLERVAGNLVENAVRHNVSGGWVTIRTSVHEGCAELEVSSSGPVIAAERVGELFEPFRRGVVARTGVAGAGLGLSIVRAVARAHGGVARGEPVEGGGLSVTVHLPLAPDQRVTAEPGDRAEKSRGERRPEKARREKAGRA
jgi:signal transduction histidine kinase